MQRGFYEYIQSVIARLPLIVAVVMAFLPIAGAVIFSWCYVYSQSSSIPHRLRLYLVAKTDLSMNTRISAEHVQFELGKLPADDAQSIPEISDVVGKYSLKPFQAGNRITANALAPAPSLNPPSGGVIVPVIVKTEYAQSLKPG